MLNFAALILKAPIRRAVLLISLLLSSAPSEAGIFTDGTRVVFKDGYREQSLRLSNQNTYPILVQAWVDDGNTDRVPEEADSPIFTMPPVFTMAPKEIFTVRLVYSGESLPQDRESVFWLNLYEIPPNSPLSESASTSLVLAIRTQMKVFYRPEKLALPISKLIESLHFSIKKSGEHGQLVIDNPTPYFATISALQITQGPNVQQRAVEMIPPFQQFSTEIDLLRDPQNNSLDIDFAIVDDNGNLLAAKQTIPIAD